MYLWSKIDQSSLWPWLLIPSQMARGKCSGVQFVLGFLACKASGRWAPYIRCIYFASVYQWYVVWCSNMAWKFTRDTDGLSLSTVIFHCQVEWLEGIPGKPLNAVDVRPFLVNAIFSIPWLAPWQACPSVALRCDPCWVAQFLGRRAGTFWFPGIFKAWEYMVYNIFPGIFSI